MFEQQNLIISIIMLFFLFILLYELGSHHREEQLKLELDSTLTMIALKSDNFCTQNSFESDSIILINYISPFQLGFNNSEVCLEDNSLDFFSCKKTKCLFSTFTLFDGIFPLTQYECEFISQGDSVRLVC